MKIAITGAGGFLGSRFIDLYGKENNISKLRSGQGIGLHTYQLNNYKSIEKCLENIDVLMHCAFDHTYKYNLIGLENFIKAGEIQGVKRLVFLSTFSVYDPYFQGALNEQSPYSKLRDPYTREKILLEGIIERLNPSFEVVILQPTIVYGLGGNWTQYAFNLFHHTSVSLPENGQQVCNAVFVDDVASAMYQSIEANLSEKITKILISEESYISWVDFYTAHLGTQMNNILSCSDNDFHDNSIVNFIFILWFTTPLGRLADFMITSIKKIRAIKYKSIKSAKSVKDLLDGPKLDSVFSPIGVTRLVHKSKFLVDYSKAKKVIGYSPIYTFEKGTAMLMKEIKE
jgi:nucleoside-diphosphate-sugar epimerase